MLQNRKIDKTIKNDFSILRNNEDLVYLNSSATSLKPDIFIDELASIYRNNITSMGRGLDNIGENDLDNNENFFRVIDGVAKHINSKSEKKVIPTFGTTDFINKLAWKLISDLEDGDEIILGKLEHASNILPWVNVIKELDKDITIKWYELKDWTVDLEHLKSLVTNKTKIMSVAFIYNTTGAKNNIDSIRKVIGKGVRLSVDATQAIGHVKIDVSVGAVDFLFFSTHKVFGPHSLGFAYIKDLMDWKIPFSFGGEMNQNYTKNTIEYKPGRKKHMAGTQDLPGIVAFGKSIEYLESFNINEIEEHNISLKEYAENRLSTLSNVRIINQNIKSSNLFFEIKNVAAEDVGYHLSQDKIIVRWGTNCVKIVDKNYEAFKAIRVSFHIYNTKSDVDKLYDSLKNGGDFIDALFKKRDPSKICA